MKSAMLSFALLTLAGLSWGQEVAPGPPQAFTASVPVTATVVANQGGVVIEGPETVTPGQPTQFSVTGLSEGVLAATAVTWFPRENVVCVPARTWAGETIIWFVPGVAAEYLIAIHAPDGLTAEIVVNTKGAPVPPPDPDPNPGPTPPPIVGFRTVLIVHESGELSPAFAQQLESVREYTSSQAHIKRTKFLDPDLKDMDQKTPEWFQGYLDLIQKNSLHLPVLMVGVLSDQPDRPLAQLFAEELPDTTEDIILAIKKYGG
jgi:hypothetical protein